MLLCKREERRQQNRASNPGQPQKYRFLHHSSPFDRAASPDSSIAAPAIVTFNRTEIQRHFRFLNFVFFS
jgi:hypothetical protein